MDIRGFIDTSLVDWDGKIAAVVFTPGCNLMCIFCYNHELVLHPEALEPVPEEEVFAFLGEHSDFIDGVCITGGEPTLQEDLPAFCRRIRALGMGVKLDTNGTDPRALADLLEEGLLNYIAMDIKAPLREECYTRVGGEEARAFLPAIKRSVGLIMASGVPYEFRSTLVPGLHTREWVEEMAQDIRGADRYVLQRFRPYTTLDPGLKDLKPQTDEEMEALAGAARKYIARTTWRG